MNVVNKNKTQNNMLKLITSLPLLLSPEAFEGGTGSDEGTLATPDVIIENDPFSAAADGIEDPKYPVIVPNIIIKMECRKCKIEKVKGQESMENLLVELKTVDTQRTTEGKDQAPGLVGRQYYGITPHEGYTNSEGKEVRAHSVEEIKSEMALLVRTFFGPDAKTSARQLWLNPDMLVGQIGMMKTGIQAAKGQYPESNTYKCVPVKKA